MAANEYEFAREFVQGIVASCGRRGEAVGPRLREFRTLQLLLLATREAQLSDLPQRLVEEVDKVLLRLGPDADGPTVKDAPIWDRPRSTR